MTWADRTFVLALFCCAACSSEVSSNDDDSATNGGGAARGGVTGPRSAAGRAGVGNPGANPNSPQTCPEGIVRTERVTPRVVLLLDGSCSMSTDYPANGARSASECTDNARGRWAALRRALIDPQSGVVTRLQGVVEFGLAIFGTQPMCPIPGTPIQPALNNLGTITQSIPVVQPGMFTPTGPALAWVYQNMLRKAGAPDANDGPQIVILATDGEPNSCGSGETNYQPSIDALMSSRQTGAQTYVISLADATGRFHDHLQQLADLGVGKSGAQLYEPGTPRNSPPTWKC